MHDVIEIVTDQIDLPELQMRTTIDRDEIHELATDIKKNGLINPITVRPKNGRYELVAGQRRYLAHQYAGIIKIRAVVRVLSDDEALSVMTSENLARADVNPIDEANHVGRLLVLHENDLEKVAGIVNRSKQWVHDRIVIANMPDYLQEYLRVSAIKLGVALLLVQIEEDDTRRAWVDLAVRDGVSVAQAQYWLYQWKAQQLPGGVRSLTPPEDYTPSAPRVVMFRCAMDDKEYDARQFRSVMIHESNIPMFNAIVSELRTQAQSANATPGGN